MTLYRKLIRDLPLVPLDRNGAARAAAVHCQLQSLGGPIGMADSLIAGIALVHGYPLFTRNRKHFAKVPGLKLIDPVSNQS